MNFQQLEKMQIGNLYLEKISKSNRQFITDLFQEPEIRKNNIVPTKTQQDHSQIWKYSINDIENNAGFTWIIYKNSFGLLSGYAPCGFFRFQYKESLNIARITYALKPEYRDRDIIIQVAKIVIDKLQQLGIQLIEADIDKNNTVSVNIVQELGFIPDEKEILIDIEMKRDNNLRLSHLWSKVIESQKLQSCK